MVSPLASVGGSCRRSGSPSSALNCGARARSRSSKSSIAIVVARVVALRQTGRDPHLNSTSGADERRAGEPQARVRLALWMPASYNNAVGASARYARSGVHGASRRVANL